MFLSRHTQLGKYVSSFTKKPRSRRSSRAVTMVTTATIAEKGMNTASTPFSKRKTSSSTPVSLYMGQVSAQESLPLISSTPVEQRIPEEITSNTMQSQSTHDLRPSSDASDSLSVQEWASSKLQAFAEKSPHTLLPEATSVPSKRQIIPEGLEYYLMKDEQRDALQPLNKHLNSLYNKIMHLCVNRDPATPKNAESLESKFEKGVLMTTLDDDEFARANKLQAAKCKFESWFSVWGGRQRIDYAAASEMEKQQAEKSSVLTFSTPHFEIPTIGVDACPGCGAAFQSENEQEFGYLTHRHIHDWLTKYSMTMKDRTEYAERRYRLLCHWAENGKQYGEEWLDFMTDQEFRSMHFSKLYPVVCSRCRALKNYRTSTEDTIMSAQDFREQLSALRDEKGLIVLVTDLSNFNGTLIQDLPSLISMNNPILLVANKLDLIQRTPMETSQELYRKVAQSHSYYRAWIYDQLRPLRVQPKHLKDIMVVSARHGWYMEQLANRIDQLTNITRSLPGAPTNAYLVGCTNVGKSSVMNALMRYYAAPQPPHPGATKEYSLRAQVDGTTRLEAKWKIPPHASPADMPRIPLGTNRMRIPKVVTTSPIPGTTIRMVGIPLAAKTANVTLYDTPGVIPRWQHRTVLNLREQAQCSMQVPSRKRLKPTYYKLAQEFTLFLSGLVAIDVIRCSHHGLLAGVYCSRDVSHLRIETELAEDTWRQHTGTLLKPPYDPNAVREGLKKTKKFLFECDDNINYPKADIYFNGLGWITFYSPSADVVLRVRAHNSMEFGVRPPLRYKDLMWRKLLFKARHPNYRTIRAHPWGRIPSSRCCHGKYSKNAKPETLIRLVDEPVDSSAPSGPVPDAQDSIHSSTRKLIGSVPDIDHTAVPFEDVLKELEQEGRLVE